MPLQRLPHPPFSASACGLATPSRRQLLLAGLGLGAGLSPAAQAQLSTNKPVTLVVPYPAGGPLDTAARTLAEQLGPLLGASVVVDNKTGAGGNLGAAAVARAQPDGHTLVMGAVATHAINPWLYPNIGYDALKDFTPLSLVARVPNVLIMASDTAKRLGIANTQDLLAYLRKNPGKLNYASGGNGSAGHLAGELFKQLTKTFMVHIPYQGAAPAMASLLGGQTELMFDNLASATPQIKAGKVLALAVTTLNRHPDFPELPALNDTVPGFHIATWFGIFGPAKLPQPLVAQLNQALVKALGSASTQEKFARMSATPAPMSPTEFAAFVQKENAAYGRLVKSARIKLE